MIVNFVVLTLFPLMFPAFAGHGIVRRAVEQGLVDIEALNIRDFAEGRHSTTDDRPYGGGNGMVLKPEPLAKAIRAAKEVHTDAKVVFLGPRGRLFDQETAARLAGEKDIIMVCGRYEGIDERIAATLIDEEISIGDYILSGGETAAMVVMDAIIRLIPGALGNESSAEQESFSNQLLEHSHFTRPPVFEGMETPEILLSGDHGKIDQWRTRASLLYTLANRPDLLEGREFSKEEITILENWGRQIADIIRTQGLHGPDALSRNR